MIEYREFAPTAFDTGGLNLPDQQNWMVGPCILTRDSEALEKSNYDEMLDQLQNLDGWEEHEFNHWACGWFSIIIAEPSSKAYEILIEIEGALADYPVLCDERFSRYYEDEESASE